MRKKREPPLPSARWVIANCPSLARRTVILGYEIE
jgi:hypothetical protein